MILLDISDTTFGQDVMAVINPLTIVICIGVAFKIIMTLYAVAAENITVDKAKIKIKQLFKVIAITASLSEMSDAFVNGYLLNGVDSSSSLELVVRKGVLLFRDLIGAATAMTISVTVVLLIVKLIEIQKSEENDLSELKKQARRIVRTGALISITLAIVMLFCNYMGVKFA